MISEKAIEINGLSKSYRLKSGKHKVIDNVSLSIEKGENVLVIGENGSGKSTLLKMLAGVVKPTQGSIHISGSVANLLEIGAGFHPDLTGNENIIFNAQLLGKKKKEVIERLEEIKEFSGIRKYLDEPVKTYSNGMFLRLAFSIVIHLDFDIYLFDEVIRVGDFEFLQKVNRKIESLKKDKAKTLLLVSHNFHDADTHSTVLLLENKRAFYGNRKLTLDRYLQKRLLKDIPGSFFDKPAIYNVPKNESKGNIVEVDDVELKQVTSDQNFRTDLPLIIKFTYRKQNSTFDLEPLLSISNQHGEIILTSGPFIQNSLNNNQQKGTYLTSIEFPRNLFNSQYYFLSLYFIREISALFKSIKEDPNNAEALINQTELISSYHQVLCFRMNYANQDFKADLSNVDIKGALLMGLDWKTEQMKS